MLALQCNLVVKVVKLKKLKIMTISSFFKLVIVALGLSATITFAKSTNVSVVQKTNKQYFIVEVTFEKWEVSSLNDKTAPLYAKSALLKHLRKSNPELKTIQLQHFSPLSVMKNENGRTFRFGIYSDQITLQ